jgi:hypothetical protein
LATTRFGAARLRAAPFFGAASRLGGCVAAGRFDTIDTAGTFAARFFAARAGLARLAGAAAFVSAFATGATVARLPPLLFAGTAFAGGETTAAGAGAGCRLRAVTAAAFAGNSGGRATAVCSAPLPLFLAPTAGWTAGAAAEGSLRSTAFDPAPRRRAVLLVPTVPPARSGLIVSEFLRERNVRDSEQDVNRPGAA